MSYSQISLEKKKYDFKIASFALSQAAILFFGATLGFWIVVIIRKDEIFPSGGTTVSGQEVYSFFICAIVFTVLLLLSLGSALGTFLFYNRYKSLLDGFIDQSVLNMKKGTPTPAAQPTQKSPVGVARPVGPTPIRRVTTTTSTTMPAPRPTPVGARPSVSPVNRPSLSRPNTPPSLKK